MGRRGNPDEGVEPSRYHRLFDLLDDTIRPKTLFMLTATPINNRLSDFRHMTELFTRRDEAYFARTLGVNNLRYMRKFYLAFPICHAPCDELESTEKRNASRSKSTDPPTDDAGDESSVAQSKPMLRPELSWTKGRPYPSQELLWRSSTISRKSLLSISSRGARAHTEKEVIGYLEKAGFVDAPTPSFPDR